MLPIIIIYYKPKPSHPIDPNLTLSVAGRTGFNGWDHFLSEFPKAHRKTSYADPRPWIPLGELICFQTFGEQIDR